MHQVNLVYLPMLGWDELIVIVSTMTSKTCHDIILHSSLVALLWDHVSHEHSFPLIPEFHVYREHLGCVL